MQYQLRWLFLAVAIIILDQLTKLAAIHSLTLSQPQPLIPLFNLTLVHNPGAAFSFLSQAGGWQRWLLAAISAIVSVVLTVWLLRLSSQPNTPTADNPPLQSTAQRMDRWTKIALALLLGGAVGNLIDRLIYGYVIDFIDFYYPSQHGCLMLFNAGFGTCHWPTFNIADSAICIGAVLLLIVGLFDTRPSS